MRMKSTPWLLVSGMLFAGTALAADPLAPQDAASQSSSLKIAIDPVTGERRALTAEESSALDAKTSELAQARRQAKSGNRSARATGPAALPATIEESLANAKTVRGITGFKPTADMLSSTQMTRNADGTLTIQHVDVSDSAATADVHAQELPSE